MTWRAAASRSSSGRTVAGAKLAAFAVFADNLDRLRALLFRAVPKIGPQPDDICANALGSAIVH